MAIEIIEGVIPGRISDIEKCKNPFVTFKSINVTYFLTIQEEDEKIRRLRQYLSNSILYDYWNMLSVLNLINDKKATLNEEVARTILPEYFFYTSKSCYENVYEIWQMLHKQDPEKKGDTLPDSLTKYINRRGNADELDFKLYGIIQHTRDGIAHEGKQIMIPTFIRDDQYITSQYSNILYDMITTFKPELLEDIEIPGKSPSYPLFELFDLITNWMIRDSLHILQQIIMRYSGLDKKGYDELYADLYLWLITPAVKYLKKELLEDLVR